MVKLEFGGIAFAVKGWPGFVTLAAVALVAAAVREQLRLPPQERTWHGRLWGLIPYDFRPPTYERLLRSVWEPASGRILKDKRLGIGWDVNLATLWRELVRREG